MLQVEGDSIAGLLTGDIDAPEASATISSGATIYGAIGSNLPTEVADPFRRIQIDERAFNPSYLNDVGPQAAVVVGLAMRRVGDK